MDKYITFKPKLKTLDKLKLRVQSLLPNKIRSKNYGRLQAMEYFSIHGWDDMLKAHHAFGKKEHTSHCFAQEYDDTIDNRYDKCACCGRSRDEIRYEDKDPYCNPNVEVALGVQNTDWQSVANTIRGEEEKYFSLIKNKDKILKLFKKLGSNGEALSILHHTHGFCPEICAEIINITPELYKDYEDWMVKESQLSKSKQIKTIITVVNE